MPVMGALEFGQLIRAARLRRGWQQQELADRIGVDRGYISTIENGKRNWPQSYVRPLSDHLGIDEVDMAVAAGLISPRVDRPPLSFSTNDPRERLLAYIDDKPLSEEAVRGAIAVMEAWTSGNS